MRGLPALLLLLVLFLQPLLPRLLRYIRSGHREEFFRDFATVKQLQPSTGSSQALTGPETTAEPPALPGGSTGEGPAKAQGSGGVSWGLGDAGRAYVLGDRPPPAPKPPGALFPGPRHGLRDSGGGDTGRPHRAFARPPPPKPASDTLGQAKAKSKAAKDGATEKQAWAQAMKLKQRISNTMTSATTLLAQVNKNDTGLKDSCSSKKPLSLKKDEVLKAFQESEAFLV